MDEAIFHESVRPVFSDEQIGEIASLMGLHDPGQIAQFGNRLQRYASAYYNARRRANHTMTPGEARKFAEDVQKQALALKKHLPKLPFVPEFIDGYLEQRRTARTSHRPSLEGLSAEIDALLQVATGIVEAPPLKRGQRGLPLLRHAVGSFMALIEATGVETPRKTDNDGSVNGKFLAGAGGVALRKIFEIIDSSITEATLADRVDQLNDQYGKRPMREGDFHLISALEDRGRFEMECDFAPIGPKFL